MKRITETINEKSSLTLHLTFYGDNGVKITPTSATYQINTLSGKSVVSATSFVPKTTTCEIVITPLINTHAEFVNNKIEERIITLTWQYGDGKQGTEEIYYALSKLEFL